MAYVKTQGGQVVKFPYTIGQLRSDNPNTSFPKRVPDHILTSYGVFEVTVEPAPAVDETKYKAVRSDAPSLNLENKWVLTWSVVEKTEEEKQVYYDATAAKVRAKRNSLLSETDWMALSDNTMPAEWAAYRQALRDITNHANFPYLDAADWPVKPE